MMSMTEGEESERATAEGGTQGQGGVAAAGDRRGSEPGRVWMMRWYGTPWLESPAAGDKDGDSSPKRRFTLEVAGEAFLLLAVGAFFLYMFIDSFSYPEGADLMPRLAVLVGTPFWLIRAWDAAEGYSGEAHRGRRHHGHRLHPRG